MLAQVARRMGHGAAFDYAAAHEIFDEPARLTGVARELGTMLDLTGMAGQSAAQFEAMVPRQWPAPASGARLLRPFSDGIFPTSDGRARFVPTLPKLPHHPVAAGYPLILNSGRTRDQWHTMTRTGRAAALSAHEPEPYVDMHRSDLQAAGLASGQLVRIVSRWGAAIARLRCSGDLPQGMVFMPIHWSESFARHSRVGSVVNPVVDPVSGEPEYKHTPVRVEPWIVEWTGFLLTREQLHSPAVDWWAASRVSQGWRYELAGCASPMPDASWLRALRGRTEADDEWLEMEDEGRGARRIAVLRGGRMQACLMIERNGELPSRAWLTSLLGSLPLEPLERRYLLRGRAPDGTPDPVAWSAPATA